MIRTFDAQALGLDAVLSALERPPERVAAEIHVAVETIVGAVRERGDDALVELTRRFDRFDAGAPSALAIGRDEMTAADIEDRLAVEDQAVVAAVRLYEASRKGRAAVLEAASRNLAG